MKPTKNKLRVNLKDWEFEFKQRERHPILMANLWALALYNNLAKEIKLPIRGLDYLFIASSKAYVRKKQKRTLLRLLRRAVEQDAYVRYVYKMTLERTEEFEKCVDRIVKSIDASSGSRELIRTYKKLEKSLLKLIPWFHIPWYVTENNFLVDKLKIELAKHKKEFEYFSDFNDVLYALIKPTKKYLLQQEQKYFYSLLKLATITPHFQKSPMFINQADRYLQKFSWIKTFFFVPIESLTFIELVQRVRVAIKSKQGDSYQLQLRQSQRQAALARRILKLLSRDKALLRYVRWSRAYGWVLNYSIEKALIVTARLQPFFKIIAARFNINYTDYCLLTSEEIVAGLLNKASLKTIDLRQRRVGYLYLMNAGKASLLVGVQALKFSQLVDDNVNPVDYKQNSIFGQPAAKGTATGRARILTSATHSHKLKRGEVLICSMTSPDYVSAMARSAAIVTDEGGLLSHAAIISRELGKPCVVGAKIATKIFKDGDLVEVDANQGMVRKLK